MSNSTLEDANASATFEQQKLKSTRKQRDKQELDVLMSMKSYVWYRPLDLGGSSKSFHTRALMRLCAKGLVEFRQRATKSKDLNHSPRGSKEYSLTALGIEEQSNIQLRLARVYE